VTRALYAVEMDAKYCGVLRQRSKGLSKGFEVVCTKFSKVPPNILAAVDVFTWFVDGSMNLRFINWLQARARGGVLKSTSVFLILFDTRHNSDRHNWSQLRQYAEWASHISYDECDACAKTIEAKGFTKESPWESCERAVGVIILAEFRVVGGLLPVVSTLKLDVRPPSLRSSNFSNGCSTLYPGMFPEARGRVRVGTGRG